MKYPSERAHTLPDINLLGAAGRGLSGDARGRYEGVERGGRVGKGRWSVVGNGRGVERKGMGGQVRREEAREGV